MNRTIVIPALLLLAAAAAQPMPAQMKNPVSTALRDVLPGRQKNTVASVEAMPAEKFNYKPTADQMTFGHLVVHIAETNDLLCSKAADVPASPGVLGRALVHSSRSTIRSRRSRKHRPERLLPSGDIVVAVYSCPLSPRAKPRASDSLTFWRNSKTCSGRELMC